MGISIFIGTHREFDAVVSDNKTVIEYDRQRISITPERWHFLPTLFEAPVDRVTVCSKLKVMPKRILWASRLTSQKRPEVMLAIAKKALQIFPDFVIDVYGNRGEDFDVTLFDGLSNLVYHGGYSSFEQICCVEYFCFLYTSAYDGIPTILLEAAGMGLPIIAPDVGAVAEFIESEVTGILLPDINDAEQMADAYVKAIHCLVEAPKLRAMIGENAYDSVVSKFGPAIPYKKKLETILGETLGRTVGIRN